MRPTGRLTTRAIAGTVAIVLLQACTHWTAHELTPQHPDLSERVRVTLVGGLHLYVTNPFLSGDSLVWFGDARPDAVRVAAGDTLQRHGVPLSQVAKIEVHRIDPVATTLALLGGISLVAIIGSSGNGGGSSGGGGSTCSPNDPSCQVSCPLVYSWDGRHWRLDSGTFGGAITRALARTDVDNLDFLVATGGRVRLKMTNELDETEYVDALAVLAVDHDPDVTIAPDAAGRLYSLGPLTEPIAGRDFHGTDALRRVRAADGVSWQSSFVPRDTARLDDIRDGLELTFVRPRGAAGARLVLDGHNTPWAAAMLKEFIAAHGTATRAWYDSLDAAPALARRTGEALAREGFLSVALRQGEGWQPQGLIWEAGPEIEKRQVLPLDLRGVSGDTVRVRLESAPSFWSIDQVALDFSPQRAAAVTVLQAARAIDRHGHDVRLDLQAADGRVLTMEQGDSALLEFAPPSVPAGRSRTYLLQSSGWYRVHSPEEAPPDVAMLRRMQTEPFAGSRLSVARLNRLLDAMRQEARQGAAP